MKSIEAQFPKLTLLSRLKLAFRITTNSEWKPLLKFDDGTVIDFSNNTLVLSKPFEIKSTENFTISTKKHLMFNSGRTQVPGREEGYRYSVCENTEIDAEGNPVINLTKPKPDYTFLKNIIRETVEEMKNE